jgi:hypothetical protein
MVGVVSTRVGKVDGEGATAGSVSAAVCWTIVLQVATP